MPISRRGALAGMGALGAGLAAAGARVLLPGDGGAVAEPRPLPGSAFASPAAGSASATASRSAAVAASAAATADAASAAPTATPSTTGSASASASPSPSPSRSMPVASASATAAASPSASASRAAKAARTARSAAAAASGASCVGAGNGQFGTWRGSPITAASAWGYDGETYSIDGDHDYARFTGIMDYAPQYDLQPKGTPFTWQGMAAGQFDQRITTDLQRLKSVWSSHPGALYYRFQHEFNGDWYRWTVDEGNVGQMVAGWRRMAGLFRDVFAGDPRFRIAWSPNAGSAPKRIKDVRSAWPGAEYVDVIAIDYYDWFETGTASQFARAADALDDGGGPIGIEAWQRFAEKQGVPWSVAEWANQFGDKPAYIQGMSDSFNRHAYSGTGSTAGKLLYQCYFNEVFPNASVSGSGDFRVQVDGHDHTGRPNASRLYRQLFGG